MGKRIIYGLLAILLSATACGPSREKLATDYLNTLHPGVSLSVQEAGPISPAYNPSGQLPTIAAKIADYAKGDATDEDLEKVSEKFEDALGDPIRYAAEHPDSQNAKGFRAWVDTHGKMLDVVFFCNSTGTVITGSTLELQERYNDLLSTLFDL